jgi:hypothetical protein
MFAMACIDKQMEQEKRIREKEEQKRQKAEQEAEDSISTMQSKHCILL